MSGYPRYILVTFISTDVIFLKSISCSFLNKIYNFQEKLYRLWSTCKYLNIRGEFKEWVGGGGDGGDGWLL